MQLHRIIPAAALAMLSSPIPQAVAQDQWPSRPIVYVVAFPPGGNSDVLGRIIAQKLSVALKVPVVVDNKPGATGMIGSAFVAKAPPDGYTLLGASIATHSINQSLFKKMQYDSVKSFEPITIIGMNANTLVVAENSPFKSVADIIAAAKAKPGTISYASTGIGTTQHLSGVLFEKLAGIQLVHVPYAGRPGITDVIGGQVDMMFEGPSVISQIKGGRVRALAVTSSKRLDGLPNVPTMAEAGVPGYEIEAWQAIFAPAKTPKPIITRLHSEIARILKMPDVVAELNKMGVQPSGMAPEEFAKFQQAEIEKWGKLIHSAGVKVE